MILMNVCTLCWLCCIMLWCVHNSSRIRNGSCCALVEEEALPLPLVVTVTAASLTLFLRSSRLAGYQEVPDAESSDCPESASAVIDSFHA